MEYQGIWIVAEQKQGRLTRIGFELLARGRELARKRQCALTAVICGNDLADAELRQLIHAGADAVLAAEAPELEHFLPEPYAEALHRLISERHPEIILAGATSAGRTLMPYLAVKTNAGLTADCTTLDIEPDTGNLLQTRPAIGGNILATIKTPLHRPQMATVRPRSANPLPPNTAREGNIEHVTIPRKQLKSRIRKVGFIPNPDTHSLQDADVVVGVGRGIKKPENLPVVQELADLLDGAIGATRDVVDRGWLTYPHQVGLSGKTITPKLYLAIGLSGSIQHLAGMQTADTIIAINSDPDAQIFNVAELGIVGDLFEIVPELVGRIRNEKQRSEPTTSQPTNPKTQQAK